MAPSRISALTPARSLQWKDLSAIPPFSTLLASDHASSIRLATIFLWLWEIRSVPLLLSRETAVESDQPHPHSIQVLFLLQSRLETVILHHLHSWATRLVAMLLLQGLRKFNPDLLDQPLDLSHQNPLLSPRQHLRQNQRRNQHHFLQYLTTQLEAHQVLQCLRP